MADRKHRRSFFELVMEADQKALNGKPLTAAERKALAERDARKIAQVSE